MSFLEYSERLEETLFRLNNNEITKEVFGDFLEIYDKFLATTNKTFHQIAKHEFSAKKSLEFSVALLHIKKWQHNSTEEKMNDTSHLNKIKNFIVDAGTLLMDEMMKIDESIEEVKKEEPKLSSTSLEEYLSEAESELKEMQDKDIGDEGLFKISDFSEERKFGKIIDIKEFPNGRAFEIEFDDGSQTFLKAPNAESNIQTQ